MGLPDRDDVLQRVNGEFGRFLEHQRPGIAGGFARGAVEGADVVFFFFRESAVGADHRGAVTDHELDVVRVGGRAAMVQQIGLSGA